MSESGQQKTEVTTQQDIKEKEAAEFASKLLRDFLIKIVPENMKSEVAENLNAMDIIKSSMSMDDLTQMFKSIPYHPKDLKERLDGFRQNVGESQYTVLAASPAFMDLLEEFEDEQRDRNKDHVVNAIYEKVKWNPKITRNHANLYYEAIVASVKDLK